MTTSKEYFDDVLLDSFDEEPGNRRARARAQSGQGRWRIRIGVFPLVAILAGIALAYVSQTAHETEANYRASQLQSTAQQLRSDSQRYGDELARLSAAERIQAAAQQLGMKPATQWSYVAEAAAPITNPTAPAAAVAQHSSGDPLQRLIAALSGSFGTAKVEAATP